MPLVAALNVVRRGMARKESEEYDAGHDKTSIPRNMKVSYYRKTAPNFIKNLRRDAIPIVFIVVLVVCAMYDRFPAR